MESSITQLVDPVFKLRKQIKAWQRLASGIKGAVYDYLTNAHIALSFGERVETLFEQARDTTERFIAQHSPKAAEKLLSIEARLREGDVESCSHAMTSCRRTLLSVADAVFPAKSEPYTDASGQKRCVGRNEYKNRLLVFITDRLRGRSETELILSELEHLSARLDAVHVKVCKGVHADVTIEEARIAVIHTYLFIAEIAKVAGGENIAAAGQSPSNTETDEG